MTRRKIIACLDIDNRRVVKGKKFQDVKELGDPLELAKKYEAEGADELVFYDISASVQQRGMFLDLIRQIGESIEIPFIVGGGIQTLSDVELAIEAGADKVSINSGALKNPDLLREASERYGSSRIMLSMDVSQSESGQWTVFAKAGNEDTGMDAIEWAKEAERLGAGEIVVNCIDEDGMRNGYNLELTSLVANSVSIPIVASGGAGSAQHIRDVFEQTNAQSALVASVLHFGIVSLDDLQQVVKEGSYGD
ncbi:imidazole glycerol phosphate synthase subunit HisF [Sporosarcina gallistercoris]|uniref:Imidazole glycerol phosphate synthase subunit HisF n=1 Tax=Sporosarcina gallistercoris TaxID=2762245 RepID=A0ABR8PI29_9BACL|nr:imidazole glycerol phosphate synthase subunit HisF [Sporosarcina gallistercoris]MBD7907842.1 imidazole glycerol phosphate synthase subunit HisF [Sporosarcina gallistercoris]